MNFAIKQSIFAFQDQRPVVSYISARAADRSSIGWGKAIVQWYRSSWVNSLENRLNELTSLPRGWNGYRSVPVSFSCASFAAKLLERICTEGLPPPSLVPGTDGTLQIEWHRNGYDVEIDVLGANQVVATRFNIGTGEEYTVELENDFTVLADWCRDLVIAEQSLASSAS